MKFVDDVKVSVIGAGFWGQNHVRVLSELKGVLLESVYDIDVAKAKNIAEKYRCKIAENLDDAIKRSDAVVISTPTSFHFQIALKALELGKHVFVEKPITSRSSEALKLIEKACREDLLLMVGHIERFNMGFRRLHDLIKSNRLGEVVSIRTKRVSSGASRISDVGVVLDLAIHDLDLVMLLTASKPSLIYSITGSKHSNNEDYAYIMMEMENGVEAYLEASWLTKRKIRLMEVTGFEGTAELNFLSQEVSVKLEKEEFKLAGPWIEPLKLELENFVKSIRGEEKPYVTGVDGYRALVCAELVLESSRARRPVKVEFEI